MPTTEIIHDSEAESTSESSAGVVKFHLSLNVASLSHAIAFYRVLLDREPAKQFDDYAKFEISEPPVVLSLEPQPHAAGGALNHLGFRVQSSQALVEMQRRLEAAGLTTTREDGVECCHVRQTKFWIADPDGNNWEIYVLEEDIPHRGNDRAPQSPAADTPATAESIAWEHTLGTPFPRSIPMSDGTVDQVMLRGTFNEPLSNEGIQRILGEAWRILRNGGKVIVHGLVSNVPLTNEALRLPGPASAVKFVAVETAPIEFLSSAGFTSIHITRFSESPVFHHESAALREMMVEARKQTRSPFAIRQSVVYLGPASQIIDDHGNVFHRGKRTVITTADLLRDGPLAGSFAFIPPGEEVG